MIMKNSGHNLQDQIDTLKKEIEKKTGCVDAEFRTTISQTINRFKSDYKSRWEAAKRMEERFYDKNTTWLDSSISFPTRKIKRSIPGRPAIPFEESTDRMKRKKTEDLRKSTPLPELVYTTQMKLKASGQGAASKIIKDILSDPSKPSDYSKAYQQSLEPVLMMSGEDAVAVLVEANLSRHQYNVLRSKSPKIYPSYKIVQDAKKQCYPEPNKIIVSETSVHADLQIMLDLTTERLIIVQREVLLTMNSDELENMCLISKWGFDGSSGHSSYKQAFYGSGASDAAVFITCFVPLRLISGSKIIWQNPRPSSTRYCRPLKIEFIKESTAVSVEEKKRIDDQIKDLQPNIVQLDGHNIKVKHSLIFAMIDGKVCNAVTNTTSTQKCYICGATIKEFNDIAKVLTRPIKTENLEFGISVLHGWIRFFECLLHLAYRLPIQKK